MSFFSKERNAAAPPPVPDDVRQGVLAEPAATTDVIGAGWRAATIEDNVFGYSERKRRQLTTELWDALPAPARDRILERQSNRSIGWQPLEALVLEEAGRAAKEDPVTWGARPVDGLQFEDELVRRQQAELQEALDILRLPGGAVAEFVGRGGRAIVDPINIALAPLGLGGSALRVIGSQAALGGLAEAAAIPRAQEQAERLGISPPDPLTRILFGAAAGGGLAAGAIGVGRVARYVARGRGWLDAGRPEGVSQLDHVAQLGAAEARLRDEIPAREVLFPPQDEASAPSDIVDRIIGIESGGNPNAQNALSSAAGLGQFIDSTWLAMLHKYRPDIVQGRTNRELLDLKFDPALSREMTAAYVAENTAYLQERGLPTTPGAVYLAHFAGPEGAARILAAAPNTPIGAVMSRQQIAANRGIRFNGKYFAQFTVGDLQAWATRKMGSTTPIPPGSEVPSFTTSRGFTGEGQVRVNDQFKIDVEYEVVDASILRQASGDLQPRDRSRINSDAWVAETAAGLDPALLRPAPTADRGTPIVGPDNVVESGNGRVRAIERAYERFPDRAAAYRAMIEAETGQPIPAGVERPVLVARRRTELDAGQRSQLVRDAQDSGVARMTPTEISQVTGRAMTSDALALLRPDVPLAAAENAGFVRRALGRLPASERNALFDATGALNAEGSRRLRQALFARAWPDRQLIGRYAELEDAGPLKSLLTALERAAPEWAALRSDIEAGLVRSEFDISPFVVDAMRLIGEAREAAARGEGAIAKVLDNLIAQIDLLEGALPDVTIALVRKFYPDGKPASAEDVAGFLSDYARRARDVGQPTMLGDDVGPAALLRSLDGTAFADVTTIPAGAAMPPEPPDIPPLPPGDYELGALSPEAEAADLEALASLRETAEIRDEARALLTLPDDIEIDLGEGLKLKPSQILADAEADLALADVIDLCKVGGPVA